MRNLSRNVGGLGLLLVPVVAVTGCNHHRPHDQATMSHAHVDSTTQPMPSSTGANLETALPPTTQPVPLPPAPEESSPPVTPAPPVPASQVPATLPSAGPAPMLLPPVIVQPLATPRPATAPVPQHPATVPTIPGH